MTVVVSFIIVALFVLSFVGLLFPLLPSALALWGGFLLYEFAVKRGELSVSFWIVATVLTLVLFVADIVANQLFVKKYGGSKWGERVAALGVIVGSLIIPPFGIILVPFCLVFVVEAWTKKSVRAAAAVAFSSVLAFLSSTLAKAFIQLFLIVYFLLDVFV